MPDQLSTTFAALADPTRRAILARLALGEAPRRSVYLVGRIGDKDVSLHGERGKLVIIK